MRSSQTKGFRGENADLPHGSLSLSVLCTHSAAWVERSAELDIVYSFTPLMSPCLHVKLEAWFPPLLRRVEGARTDEHPAVCMANIPPPSCCDAWRHYWRKETAGLEGHNNRWKFRFRLSGVTKHETFTAKKKEVQVLASCPTSYVISVPWKFYGPHFSCRKCRFNYLSLAVLIIYWSIMSHQAFLPSGR